MTGWEIVAAAVLWGLFIGLTLMVLKGGNHGDDD